MSNIVFFETSPIAAPAELKGEVTSDNIGTIVSSISPIGFIEIYAKCNTSGVLMTHIKENQVEVIEQHIKLEGEQMNKDVKNKEWECVVLDKDHDLFYLRPILAEPLICNNTKENTSYLLCADSIGLIATLNGMYRMGKKIKSRALNAYSAKLFQYIEIKAFDLLESWEDDGNDATPMPDDIINGYHFASFIEGWPNTK